MGDKKVIGIALDVDLMRFGWMESAREEICHVEEMEQISRILD